MRTRPTLLAAAVLVSVLTPGAFCVTPTFTSVMNAQAVRDASGFIYAFGYTDDPAFPTTHGAYQPQFIVTACGHYMGIVSTYCVHGYVAKLNPAGAIVWCTFLKGSVQDQISALALDSTGNIWVAGTTQSPDFPVTPNAIQLKPAYTFLSEISPDGSQLLYSTFLGGNSEEPVSLNVDSRDKVYIFGYSENPDFAATPGAYNSQPAGCGSVSGFSQYCFYETYARKFDPAANQLVYSTLIAPVESPNANLYLGLQLSAVDETGVFYVAGYTHRSDYPITPGVYSNRRGILMCS
jgi:hypothetical protein